MQLTKIFQMPHYELVQGNFTGQSLFDVTQFDPKSIEVFNSTKAEMTQSIRNGQIPQLFEPQIMFSAFSNYKISGLMPIRFAFESGFIKLGGLSPRQSGDLPTEVGKTFDHHVVNGIGIHGPDIVIMGHRSKMAVRRAVGLLADLEKPIPILDVITLEKMGLVDPNSSDGGQPAAMAVLKLVLPGGLPPNKML